MLKKEKLINLAVINNMSTWQHSGFNVHCSSSVNFSDTEAIERLARYIVRAHISQERMKYIPDANSSDGEGKVIYEGKTTGRFETFSALDFLARLVTHIPNKYEQTVRYYGYYSNKSRGVRAKAEANDATVEISSESTNISSCSDHSATCPNQGDISVAQPQTPAQAEDLTIKIPISLSRKRFKKNWSRLIQKIYNVDPLKCPNCGGRNLIHLNPEVLCSSCDWDSLALDVSRGAMDDLDQAVKEIFINKPVLVASKKDIAFTDVSETHDQNT